MKTDLPEDGDDISPAERKAHTARRMQEFAQIECALVANRKALQAKGEPVDAMLKELREKRAAIVKADENLDKVEEAARVAEAARDAAVETLRQAILQSREQWETAIEDASGERTAQERVELWEGYQAWKRSTRKQIEEAGHGEMQDLL